LKFILNPVLTGTPVQNNLLELWSLLHFLYPAVFTPNTSSRFQSSFDLTKGTYSFEFMNHVKQLLGIIMLRRTKDSVPELTGEDNGIPPREEIDVFLPMVEYQRFWYLRLLTKSKTRLSFTPSCLIACSEPRGSYTNIFNTIST
jgi:SWI/SNF-related matrix-associated actin-dependent regulator of chromatin subfamily A member 5